MNPLLQKLTDIKNEKDQYLVPENVRKDVEVLGITGTLEELDTSDATATAEDIASGKTAYVNNQKITGNMREYKQDQTSYLTSSFTDLYENPTSFSFLHTMTGGDIAYYKEYSKIEAKIPFSRLSITNLSPKNIKSGVTILGVSGSVVELQGQTKTVTPTAEQQVITPDQGYNGLTQVTVEAVEDLTPQIQAQEQIIAQLQEEVAKKSTEVPTLELYDVLDIKHTGNVAFETNYIPKENTEIILEYEDWLMYSNTFTTTSIFGIRSAIRQTRNASSTTYSNSFGLSSNAYGNFKFGDQELKPGTSKKMADVEEKFRLKLNKNGIYRYNFNTNQYETFALFLTQPIWNTIQDTMSLFVDKQYVTISSTGETYYNYNTAAPLNVKFHFMEIYENGVLKAKYVPAKYGNEIGVYDTVAQKMLDRITPLDVYNEND